MGPGSQCFPVLVAVGLVCACSTGSERHDIETTRACLEDRQLRVQHLRKERPPQLVVFHPSTEAFVELLVFYDDNQAARAAAQQPAGRTVVLPRRAVDNVLISGFWNERDEIRDCL
jgi:hypothetical protein